MRGVNEDDEEARSELNFFEALVAAKEGRPGAATAALEAFLERNPDYKPSIAHAAFVAKRRPDDYWNLGAGR